MFDTEVGYTGHGELFPDLHGPMDEILPHRDDLKETLADMLAETGPTTGYLRVQELFSNLPVTEIFPGMSDIIGHLDRFEDGNMSTSWTKTVYRRMLFANLDGSLIPSPSGISPVNTTTILAVYGVQGDDGSSSERCHCGHAHPPPPCGLVTSNATARGIVSPANRWAITHRQPWAGA